MRSSFNPVQLLAMAIREASVIPLQSQRSNVWTLEQLTAIEMILSSVNREQLLIHSVCSPVQCVDSDMMLSSVISLQNETYNDSNPTQLVDNDMILASVSSQHETSKECSPVQ